MHNTARLRMLCPCCTLLPPAPHIRTRIYSSECSSKSVMISSRFLVSYTHSIETGTQTRSPSFHPTHTYMHTYTGLLTPSSPRSHPLTCFPTFPLTLIQTFALHACTHFTLILHSLPSLILHSFLLSQSSLSPPRMVQCLPLPCRPQTCLPPVSLQMP